MSRYTFKLDTVRRSLSVTDTETDSILRMEQIVDATFWEDQGENDGDTLVEFANDLANDLHTGVLALELQGHSVFTFHDNKFPTMSGGVKLRDCIISHPTLINVDLKCVKIESTNGCRIVSTTAEHIDYRDSGDIILSHCFINELYSTVKDRLSPARNEWFMNQRVEGEIW